MAQRIADLTVGEQTGVGVGRVGEPMQHRREQAALDRGRPADTVGQRLDVAQRACGVGKPQRRQPIPGLRGREPDLLDGQPCHRRQQWLVEKPLVQPAHEPGDPGMLALDLLRGGETERSSQPAQLTGIAGQGVHPAEPLQLQAVLGTAQEAVRVREAGRIPAGHIATASERVERGQRRDRPQLGVGPAVDELEQLDGELDIAQPARTEFEVTVSVSRRQRPFHPPPHRLDVADEPRPRRGRPDQRPDRGAEPRSQLMVARDRARLEQRLELPGSRPSPVVGVVAGQRTHQRAVPPFGPQPHVDLEQRALTGDRPTRTDHPLRETGGHLQRGGLVGPGVLGSAAGPSRFRHEQDVDVADIVQLPATALTHTDDGETNRRSRRPQRRPRHGERGVKGGSGEAGKLRGGIIKGHGAGEITSREDEQSTAIGNAQRVQNIGTIPGGARLGLLRVRSDSTQQTRTGDTVVRRGPQHAVVSDHPPVGGMADQMVTERGTRTEHRDKPAAQPRLTGQRREQLTPGRGRRRRHDPFHRRKRQVGISRPRKRHQDRAV